MGWSTSTWIVLLGLFAVLLCVFGDPSTTKSASNVETPNVSHSTASDTLTKEGEAIKLDGFNTEELKKIREKAEKHEFNASVDKMMELIIHSLYKNKEIFLRELISNASDAIDKIRVQSLTDGDALHATAELSVRVKANKEDRTLHIIDTGIGMNKSELENNLGTIAKSGTKEFMEQVAAGSSTEDYNDFIGQFGVGFYSSFLVCDKVRVISKSNSDKQYIWESDSKSYTIYEDPRGDTLKRGTEVILHLVEEAEDFLEPERLKSLARKYSQFISHPIYVWGSKVETVTVDEPEEKTDKTDSEADVEEEKKSEPKTVEKTVWDWIHINEQKPIWRRKPSEIAAEEYKAAYNSLSKDQDEPLGKVHFKAEGDISFSALLFVPKIPPHDLFNKDFAYKDRIKLYVHRVFISDAAEELIPSYFGFLLGVVDSDELPLNVSRETLQQNQLVKLIKRKIVRKVIEMLGKLSEDDFQKFWAAYSISVKLGTITDQENRVRLSKLLRFKTSKSTDKPCSLADYVSRMKKNQKEIYYLTGPSLTEIQNSSLAERLIDDDFEVVYMTDAVDEYLVQSLLDYEKKPLKNVAKEGLELKKSEASKARKELLNKEYAVLLKWLKEEGLKDKIEKAELSERLSRSPCALVAAKYGWSGNMERILRAQTHQTSEDTSSAYYASMKKTLEINPRHPLIRELNKRVNEDSSDEGLKNNAELLFYIASLRSGYSVTDSLKFAKDIEMILRKDFGVPESAEAEDEPVEPEDLEENRGTDEEIESKEETSEASGTSSDSVPKSESQIEDSKDEESASVDKKDEL